MLNKGYNLVVLWGVLVAYATALFMLFSEVGGADVFRIVLIRLL